MDAQLGNRNDSEKFRLGPKSYQWTRALLSDPNKKNPTRFELFNARKKYQAIFIAKRRSEFKFGQILHMWKILKACTRFYREQIGDEIYDTMGKIIVLARTKLVTRSFHTKVKKFDSECSAIFDELSEKTEIMSDIFKFKDLGELPELLEEELNVLNGRIVATRELRDEVLEYLEN